MEQIIRAKCIRYGIKASNILASRLKTLYDLCHGTLVSMQSRNQLTINSFITAIRMIYEKQRNEDFTDSRTTSSTAINSGNKYGTAKIESETNCFI